MFLSMCATISHFSSLFCVSIVGTAQIRRRPPPCRTLIVAPIHLIVAKAADGADGPVLHRVARLKRRRAHRDESRPGPAFTAEGDLDAKRAQECLRAS